MLKAIIGLSITLLLMVTTGTVMGFIYLFSLVPMSLGIIAVTTYVTLLIVLIVLIVKLLNKIKVDVEKVLKEIKLAVEKFKKLSPLQIAKIILKLMKK